MILPGLSRLVNLTSLGACHRSSHLAWADANPWTFLRYAEPPSQVIGRPLEKIFPNTHMAILYVIAIAAFATPHAVAGLAGGWLTAKAWAMKGGMRWQ